MAIDYTSKNQPQYTDTATSSKTDFKPSSPKERLFGQKVAVTPEQTADIAIELQQLEALRQQTINAAISHLRTQLSQKLAFEQVGQLLDHPNTKRELTRLIHKVVLSPHQNLDSYTYAIAKGITEIAEPHLRLAANIATVTAGKDTSADILQEALRSNANIKSSYNPLAESLKPIDPNSTSSKLAASIKAPLVVDKENVPSLKPEVEKIVASGLKKASPEKVKQISHMLHQDLVAEILTHQPKATTSTNQLVKHYLEIYGLDPELIGSKEYTHFVEYVDRYHQVVSANDSVALAQVIAESEKTTATQLQDELKQLGETPEKHLHSLQTAPAPKPPPLAPLPIAITPSLTSLPKEVIHQADEYDYTDHINPNDGGPLNDFIRIIRFISQSTPNYRQEGLSRFQIFVRHFTDGLPNFFRSFLGNRGGGITGQGPSPAFKTTFPQGFSNPLKNWAKDGFSKAARGLGGAAKTAAKAVGKALLNAGKAALRAGSKALAQLATKTLLFNPYFWIGVVVMIIVVALIYVVAGASPQKVALMQADSISGQGGGGLGLGFCDPEVNENCLPLFCEGDCKCPVTGYISQGPGGDFTHLIGGRAVNAVDITLTTGDPIYSLSSGVVSFAAFSPSGYGNLVIVDNDDGTQLYYAHLEWFNVAVGQQVSAGEQLGAGNNTGFSTGPHLHLEYRGAGVQNVLALIGFSPEQIEILNGCNGIADCGNILCQN